MLRNARLVLAAAAVSLGLVATSAPAGALPDWRTTPTVHRSNHVVRVLGLRYSEHARFDRVVIDLRRRQPGYRIAYANRVYYEGSGKPVRLHGRQKMSLTILPAFAHTSAGANLYKGPRKVRLDLPTLRGIAFTGDFEGQVSFGFGTDRKAPYRIFTRTNPSRLVIDWRH